MITLDDARGRVGDAVVYSPMRGAIRTPLDDGVVTSVNESYVFVRFSATGGAVACRPDDLDWLTDHPGRKPVKS